MSRALQLMSPTPEGEACMAWIEWLPSTGGLERWTEQHPTATAAREWIERQADQVAREGGTVTGWRVSDQEVLVAAPSAFALLVHAAGKVADRARALEATGYRGEANALADLIPTLVRVLRDVGIPCDGVLLVSNGGV